MNGTSAATTRGCDSTDCSLDLFLKRVKSVCVAYVRTAYKTRPRPVAVLARLLFVRPGFSSAHVRDGRSYAL